MDRNIKLFFSVLKQEVELISQKKLPFTPAWNISEEINSSEFLELINRLFSDQQLKDIYETEENIKAAFLRAVDRYLINVSFSGKLKFDKRLAKKIYLKWKTEVFDSKVEIVVLASVLNFEVNKPLKFGNVEFFPVLKNGPIIELEKNIYKLLGFRGVRDIKRMDELASFKIAYFLGGNAIRVKAKFPKRKEFYKYPSFPEPGHKDLIQNIRNFSILLRIFKSGDFLVGSYHTVVSSHFTPGEVRSGEIKYSNGYQYPLVDKSEIIRFRYFVKKYLPSIESLDTLPTGLQIGLEYLNSSYEKIKVHEKFIDIMIALDALLGTQAETSYRLSLRASCFLSSKKTERKEIYKHIKDALKLRGKIVHGDIHPNQINQTDIEQNKLYIENIVRRLLVKLLSLHVEGELTNDYKKDFDEKFVL